MSGTDVRACLVCGEPIYWGRRDRLTCSSACRQRRSRAGRGVGHGWGGVTDRQARRARARAKEAVTGQQRPRGGA
ncbi:MAG: hypothetical protein ACP5VP_11470 [Candidatus Limnocylindrales bacterium]